MQVEHRVLRDGTEIATIAMIMVGPSIILGILIGWLIWG
jgi:hypothetical protein